MKKLKAMLGRLIRTALMPINHVQIRRLERGAHACAPLLAATLRASSVSCLAPEEREWIERIEQLRQSKSRSTQAITVVDYGAGSPERTLSKEEMYHGRVVPTTVGEMTRRGSKPQVWALVLFQLIRKFQPENCLELGACVGISGAYHAAALQLNGKGRLATMEGAEALAEQAENTFSTLGLDMVTVIRGRFQDTLEHRLATGGALDYVFIDGHHEKQATLEYFEMIVPVLSRQAIVVFDDINWSSGMREAWHAIARHERVALALDLSAIGICIVDANGDAKEHFNVTRL